MKSDNAKNQFKNHQEVNSLQDIFFRFLDAFRRLWFVPAGLIIILGVLGFFYYKHTYVPSYQSKAIFNVTAADYSGENRVSYSNNNQLTEDLSVSFNYLINNEVFYEIIKNDLGTDYVPATIDIYPVSNTNILNIITRGSDAEMTYKTSMSVLNNYEAVTEFVVGDTKLKILEKPQKAIEPDNPYNPILTIILFAFIGLVLGAIPALIIAIFVKTIQNRDDVNKYLSINFIGSLPYVALDPKADNNSCSILNKEVGFRYVESMRSISSRCERMFKDENAKTIVVTSTSQGEGKSTFSMNLAYSLSKMEYKVMLVDGNLRKPALKGMVNVEGASYSLGEYFEGKIKSSEAITNLKDTRVLAVAPDKPTENPVDLINSDKMQNFMDDVKSVVDYVIIDVPPCSDLSDAAAFAQYSDAVVYVVKEDYVRVNKIINTLQEFSYTKKPILGCVLNGSLGNIRNGYGYGKYSYGKYGYGKYGYGLTRKGYGNGQYGMYGYGYGDSHRSGYEYGYGSYDDYQKNSKEEFDTATHKLPKHIKMNSTEEEKKAIEKENLEEDKEQLENMKHKIKKKGSKNEKDI